MIIISGWYHLNFDHLEGGCMWLPNFDYNIRVEWRRRRRSWIAPNYSDYKENSRCSFHVPDLWPSNVILINGRSDRPFSLVLRKICYYYLRHHHHLQCSSRTTRRERGECQPKTFSIFTRATLLCWRVLPFLRQWFYFPFFLPGD